VQQSRDPLHHLPIRRWERPYSLPALRQIKQLNGYKITQPKRIKAWWFVSESGKCCIAIRYGSKVLELAKGKTAIEVASAAALIDALEAVNAAVIAGELDAQIEAASGQLRSAFVK
jgi:hypothetical protein